MEEVTMVIGNKSMVCHDPRNIESIGGIWTENPLYFSTPLLLMQLFIISLFSLLMNLCLRPLGQSTMVAQIFGGMLFGPSALGYKDLIGTKLFPIRSLMVLETSASFGLMFFLFVVSVQMDLTMMTKPGKRAIYIAISVMFVSLAFTVSLALLLMKYVPMDATLANSLPYIAVAQCLTPFPNIACLLTELKILNTDLGRLGISIAMFCDVIGITLTAVCFAILSNTSGGSGGGRGGGGQSLMPLWAILSSLGVVGVIIFAIRPAISLAVRRLPPRKPVGELYIQIIFISVLIFGFLTEVVGQHYALGPIILGLVVPEGPPLGSAIVKKLDYPIFRVLYPTYITTSGLKTNIFTINFQASWIVAVIVIVSFFVKIVAIMLPAHFTKLSLRDAFVLGLILNAKGISELIVYNLWRDTQVLTNELFALSVISVIVVTAIITPLIKFLYDPSKQHIPTKRRSIQGAKRDAELRILICIHSLENVTSLINLLEASNASEENLVHAVAIILVELVGRTAPVLIEHPKRASSFTEGSTNNISHRNNTGQIIGALRQFEQCNENRVTLRTFSSVSHYEMMHDDICSVAREHKSSIVIVPFHKHFAIDGSIGTVNRALQGVNLKVLERAPCTVGILVDRGILNGSVSFLVSQALFHVAVVYIGGPDDLESLSYGDRMVRRENVTVTIIRFLLFGSDNARERKFDNDRIEEVRRAHAGSPRLMYLEEVVRDGVGLASCMRGLEEGFDLMVVGKNHPESPMLVGLHAWNEYPELGVIGDMLASPDFGTTASVLVLQQQNVLNRATVIPVVNEQETTPQHHGGLRPSTARPSTARPSTARLSTSSLTPRTTPITTPRREDELNSNNTTWTISINRS